METMQLALPSPETLFARYLAHLDAGSPRTEETYARALRRFFAYLREEGVARPERADVLRYRDRLLAEGRSAATARGYLCAVRSFFAFTAGAGLYPNIAEGVRGPRVDREGAAKDYLTPASVRGLLGSVDRGSGEGRRDYALLLLAVTTGLRAMELAGADAADMRPAGEATVLYVRGKGRADKRAFVKVHPEAEAAIRAYLAGRGRLAEGAPLFASLSNRNCGGRLSVRSVSRIVKQRLRAAGFDGGRLTAHSLRHTAGMLALLGGEPVERVRQLLRHRDLSTTMVYLNHLSRLENRCAETIMGMIGGDGV